MRFIDAWGCTNADVRKVWDEAYKAHEPVLFYGARHDVQAPVPGGWARPTPDVSMTRLRKVIGDREVPVVRQAGPEVMWDPMTGLGQQGMSFEDFERAMQLGEKVYLQSTLGLIMDGCPESGDFYRDMAIPAPWKDIAVAREKFWVSGRGLVTPLHYDAAETMHWVLKGVKTFRLYRPGLNRYAPYPANSTAPFISKLRPTDLAPEGGDEVFEMHEGDILYLPSYWWHWVRSEDSVNVSMNYVWRVGALRQLANFRQMWRCRAHVKRQLG